MKVVDYEKHGGPDVLRIKERPKPTVKFYEIMIQVEAIGLNVCDTWLRQGVPFHHYCYPEGIGCECSGKVIVVGSDTCEFKEGDEVCASLQSGGAYAEFVVVHERDVLRIPSGVSLVQAAALPKASRLTIFALSVLKNVTLGNTILIHDTAGGIDFIAIQYVKHIGGKVFAVAESIFPYMAPKNKARVVLGLMSFGCFLLSFYFFDKGNDRAPDHMKLDLMMMYSAFIVPPLVFIMSCSRRCLSTNHPIWCFVVELFQSISSSLTMIGSIQISIMKDEEENFLCCLGFLLASVILLEIAIEDTEDCGVCDIILALFLTKLNSKDLEYVPVVCFISYLSRKLGIFTMKQLKNERAESKEEESELKMRGQSLRKKSQNKR